MLVDDLKEVGMSENEAKVYIALLELGRSTTGPLIKKTGMYRVMVYDTLQKNRKHFEAEDPRQILELVKSKEEIAKTAVENLSKIQTILPLEKGAFVYEGWNGIKAAHENYIKEMKEHGGGEYVSVGASREMHKKLDAFFNYFHERRSKMGIPGKILFNANNRRFGSTKRQYKPVHVKFMPVRIITPSWISTYKDMTLIGVAEDSPMAIFIKNESVAKSYRQYFYFMWEQSTS